MAQTLRRDARAALGGSSQGQLAARVRRNAPGARPSGAFTKPEIIAGIEKLKGFKLPRLHGWSQKLDVAACSEKLAGRVVWAHVVGALRELQPSRISFPTPSARHRVYWAALIAFPDMAKHAGKGRPVDILQSCLSCKHNACTRDTPRCEGMKNLIAAVCAKRNSAFAGGVTPPRAPR